MQFMLEKALNPFKFFFFKSRFTLQILLSLLYYFAAGSSVTEVCKILVGHVSKKIALLRAEVV